MAARAAPPAPNGDLQQTSRAGLVRRPAPDDVDQQHHAEWWGRSGRTRAEPLWAETGSVPVRRWPPRSGRSAR